MLCLLQLVTAVAVVTANSHDTNDMLTQLATLNTSNKMAGYSFGMEQDGENEGLIHIPLRSRASVLKERKLHHILEEELDEEASETFARWARNNNDRSLRSASDMLPDATNNNQRRLQDFSGEGTHFIEAFVGSPAQKRLLAVSSGADFTAFPCEGCTQCGPIISSFLQSFSSSFITMPCGRCVGGQREDVCDDNREKCMARGYNLVDKSAWTAYEARDYIYVGGAEEEIEKLGLRDVAGTNVPEEHGFPLVFACQTEATGWYASQVQDGVIGFSTARTSFVNQMVFQDQLKYPRFCMCFEQRILMGDDMRSAGVVTLGGYNPNILDAPLVYVQNTETKGTRYKVHVKKMYFRQGGGQSIVPDRDGQAVVRLNFDDKKFNEKNGGTILDSGVPLLIFDESIQQSFMSEWKKMVGTDFTFGKMLITENDVKNLPTIILQITAHEGVDKSFNPRTVPNMAGDRDPQHPFDALLAIPATHYMEYNPSTGTYRAKITLDSKLGSFLGINAMQGHAFFYDLSMDRIGFAESYNCQPKMGFAGLVDDDMFDVATISNLPESGSPYDSMGPGTGPIDGGMPDRPEFDTPGRSGPGFGPEQEELGRCVTATCISFVTVGYCIVVIALAVVYKKHKPRDRSKQFDREIAEEDDSAALVPDDQTEVLNPVFEQHLRNSGMGGLGGSVRGTLA